MEFALVPLLAQRDSHELARQLHYVRRTNYTMSSYYDPERNRDVDSKELANLPEDEQAEIIKHWFLQHYEDPAENTPYESAEGGYIYIWGGPHDAAEVLWSEFGNHIQEEILQKIAEELESECGVTEWASIPGPEDFDFGQAYFSDFHPRFRSGLAQIRNLLDHTIASESEPTFLALLYANAITLLEAYLGDVFISLVLKYKPLLRTFVEGEPAFHEQKFTLAELFKKSDAILGLVKEHLYILPFHRLEKVQMMYKSVLGIKFPSGLGAIFKAIQTRHDIVHRNGVTKDGTLVVLEKETVTILIKEIESLVDTIDCEVVTLVEKLTQSGQPNA